MTTSSSFDDVVTAAYFLTEGGTSAKHRTSDVDSAIKVIQGVAKERGLEPDCIEVLMDYVLGKEGTGTLATQSRVLRCLIPRTTVPLFVIFRALSSMRMLSNALRTVLFRWMVLVYDLVDRKDQLRVIYDGVLQYLGYDDLRASACQLLCYMTTRSHVTEFRVEGLMKVYKQVVMHDKEAGESPLMALLAIYKLYSPHLVPIGNIPAHKVWFRLHERDLASNICRVQSKRPELHTNADMTSDDRVQRCLRAVPPPAKRRRKAGSIPDPTPSLSHKAKKDLVPIATLTTVEELCNCIDRIELPSHMVSVFKSPLLRHVFSVWPDPSAAHRLTFWLQMDLGHELDSYEPGNPESPHLIQMLDYILHLTDFLNESVPPMEMFLLILLESWNGSDYSTQVFRLLKYLSLETFEDVDSGYLQPLKRLFVKKGLWFKCSLLACLTDLLRFWVTLEWSRYQERLRVGPGHSRICVFPSSPWNKVEDPLDFDPSHTITLLVHHTENLFRIAHFQEQGHSLINHAAATFYEVVTSLPGDYGIPLVLVPHQQIVNQAMLGMEPSSLSRILSSCVRCRSSIASVDKSRRDHGVVTTFNRVVLEMCDGLWRDHAFSKDSPSAQKGRQRRSRHGKLPDLTTTDLFTGSAREYLESCGFSADSIRKKFNVGYHPALVGFVREFFRKTQGSSYHRLKPNAIWREIKYADSYLQYIEKRGLTGISSFLRTFIDHSSLNNSAV